MSFYGKKKIKRLRGKIISFPLLIFFYFYFKMERLQIFLKGRFFKNLTQKLYKFNISKKTLPSSN